MQRRDETGNTIITTITDDICTLNAEKSLFYRLQWLIAMQWEWIENYLFIGKNVTFIYVTMLLK